MEAVFAELHIRFSCPVVVKCKVLIKMPQGKIASSDFHMLPSYISFREREQRVPLYFFQLTRVA